MFADSYREKQYQTKLSTIGAIGTFMFFFLINFITQWPLIHTDSNLSFNSQVILIFVPLIFPMILSLFYWLYAHFSHTERDYSYAVAYYWTLISLMPLASLVSLIFYLSLPVITAWMICIGGFVLSLILYSALARSYGRSLAEAHDKIVLFALTFYAVGAILQILALLGIGY
ncbi:MAG: hypothetical protein FWE43_01925 [Streptococcaceae bacterium]|nr:hypothetical protein [Streptococcaceae bacterium]